MSINDIERGAFSLFSREGLSDEYKRTLCYIVYKALERQAKAMQMDRLVYEISQNHAVSREDVKGAISALRSPIAFDAMRIFQASDRTRLCRVHPSETISLWLQEVERDHPHLCRVVQ